MPALSDVCRALQLIARWEDLPWKLEEKAEPGIPANVGALVGLPNREIAHGARELLNGAMKSASLSAGDFGQLSAVRFGESRRSVSDVDGLFMFMAPALWSNCARFDVGQLEGECSALVHFAAH